MKIPKLKRIASGVAGGNRKIKRRIVAGAVAAATALSVLVGSAVDNPAELVKPVNDPPAIIEVMTPVPDNDMDNGTDEAVPEEKKKSIKARIKEFILKMPLAVRILVCLPLWIIGTAVIAAAAALNVPVFQPVLTVLAKMLISTAVFLGMFCTAVKAVAPDIPVKKILRKKNILTAVFVITVLEAAAAAVTVFVEDGNRYVVLAKAVFMMSSMIVITGLRIAKRNKTENG